MELLFICFRSLFYHHNLLLYSKWSLLHRTVGDRKEIAGKTVLDDYSVIVARHGRRAGYLLNPFREVPHGISRVSFCLCR